MKADLSRMVTWMKGAASASAVVIGHVVRRYFVDAVTLVLAAVVIAASLFNWYSFSDDTYRNVALSLAALILLASLVNRADRKRLDRSTEDLKNQLTEWRSTLRLKGIEIEAAEISQRLSESLSGAECWSFSGGTGSWQREAVLPELAKIQGRDVNYRMQVINPFDDALCETYANYRKKSGATSATCVDDLRCEIIASALALAWYAARSRVRPQIHFTTDYSPIRLDSSQTGVFVTSANKRHPGMYFGKPSWFHELVDDEFDQDARTLPQLDIDDAVALLTKGTDDLAVVLASMVIKEGGRPVGGKLAELLPQGDDTIDRIKELTRVRWT